MTLNLLPSPSLVLAGASLMSGTAGSYGDILGKTGKS